MTREKAITELHKAMFPRDFQLGAISCSFGDNRRLAERSIDGYIALRMLTVEETRDAESYHPNDMVLKTRNFMRAFHLGEYTPSQLRNALTAAGLKIVEA